MEQPNILYSVLFLFGSMNGGILADGDQRLMGNGKMDIYEYTLINYIFDFYMNFMPFVLFILCYLLFKKSPSKIAYLHLGLVVFIVVFKHWATLFHIAFEAEDFGIVLDNSLMVFEYLTLSIFTAVSCLLILALMHRPSNQSYDKILKKEIWGVWYQENNSSDYFDKNNQKSQKDNKDE